MKSLIALLVFFFALPVAHAKEIQLLNPDFFGQPASSPAELHYEGKADQIEPYLVTTGVKDGKFHAASVFYPATVTFAEAREALNRLYGRYEIMSLFRDAESAAWRVSDKQFAIQLLRGENHLRMIYLQIQADNEILKSVIDPKGACTDSPGDGVCK